MIQTNENYWDCECEHNYIHSKREKECLICGAIENEQPDSRQNEIDEGTHFHNNSMERWNEPNKNPA